MTALNAHRVFTDAPNDADYLHNITVPDERVSELRAARDAIRATLREAIPSWTRYLRETQLFEAVAAGGKAPTISQPKFRMQGSMAYHTLNDPAHAPPQQVDVDDGMFLPVSYFEKGGYLHPSVASQGLFALVETALQPLCAKRGWAVDRSKPTCVRVKLDETAHVDLALYAIPDAEFQVLVEKALGANPKRLQAELVEAVELSEQIYRAIPRDHIMLAHREENWKPSDPRKLEDWVTEAVKTYGLQLRRIWRYLKGWRDEQWEGDCRLSSIALMRCAVDAYEQVGKGLSASRDDIALLRVAETLPRLLNTSISNPVVDGQYLDEGWRPEQRRDYVTRAMDLASGIRTALETRSGARDLLETLTTQFGDRIPVDPSLVREDDQTAAVTVGLVKELGESPEARRAVEKQGGGRYA